MGRHDLEERLRLMETDPEAAAMAVLRRFCVEEPESEFAARSLSLLEEWRADRAARKEAQRQQEEAARAASSGGRDGEDR